MRTLLAILMTLTLTASVNAQLFSVEKLKSKANNSVYKIADGKVVHWEMFGDKERLHPVTSQLRNRTMKSKAAKKGVDRLIKWMVKNPGSTDKWGNYYVYNGTHNGWRYLVVSTTKQDIHSLSIKWGKSEAMKAEETRIQKDMAQLASDVAKSREERRLRALPANLLKTSSVWHVRMRYSSVYNTVRNNTSKKMRIKVSATVYSNDVVIGKDYKIVTVDPGEVRVVELNVFSDFEPTKSKSSIDY